MTRDILKELARQYAPMLMETAEEISASRGFIRSYGKEVTAAL